MKGDRALTTNSQVPKGYKQTEVGVIPEDWNITRFNECVEIAVGGDLKEDNFSPIQDDVFRYPVFSNTVSDQGLYGFYNIAEYQGESLTVVGRGVGLGTAFKRSGEYSAIGRLLVLLPKPFSCAGFLTEYINHRVRIHSESGGIPQLPGTSLAKYLVALPPTIAEQNLIASALSDTDALIESLEQLLAKKRQIKQGAMQELFYIADNDQEKPLVDISTLKGRIGWQGLKQTEFTNNADEPFLITGMNFKDGAIRWEEVYHISEDRYSIAEEIQLKPDDVLMTKDGTIGKLLYVDEIPYPGKASLNSHLLLFRPIRNSYHPQYLYHQLSSKRFKDFIALNKSGTTFFGISQESVGKYSFLLPPIERQKEISTILSDMDLEIGAIETKLAKVRQLKQGMMHELLTGRIRLIEGAPS
jgi:type I restriction enzyme S subunit